MIRLKAGLGFGALAAAGLMALATDSVAASTAISAIAGMPFIGTEASCFTRPMNSSRVTNTCAGTRTWLVPFLTTPVVGMQLFASAAGAGTAPVCRAIVRSAGDGQVSFGGQTPVGIDTPLGGVAVNSSSDVGHVDCLLAQNGKGLMGIRWTVP